MSSPDPAPTANYQLDGATFFLLVGSQRSGTNFLRELLVTHPDMVVHGEVFFPYPLPNCYHNFVRTMTSRTSPPVYEQDAVALLDDYTVFLREDCKRSFPEKAGRTKAIGLDVKYNQLRFVAPVHHDLQTRPFLLEYCGRRGVPILHLVRTNVLHQALSVVIAEVRNVYHNYGGSGVKQALQVPTQRLLECARWLEGSAAMFREMTRDLRVLEISYERLVAACARAAPGARLGESARVMGEIATFLGIDNEFLHPASIKKVVDKPYSQIVANYAEVVAAVRASEFEPFLATI